MSKAQRAKYGPATYEGVADGLPAQYPRIIGSNAWKFLQTWIRWATFCEKYTQEHCELAAHFVRQVAENNRK